MHLEQNVSLKSLHTFGFDVKARYYVEAKTKEDIYSLLNYRSMIRMPILIIGAGSNILFTKDFEGIIIRIHTKGITVREVDEEQVILSVQAGESWDPLVAYCVDQGWAGLENLSLIPGTVGAAPIQNIGAYGTEVKDLIESVHFVEIESGEERTFSREACHFGYRDSIFKQAFKGKIIIDEVHFRLQKINGENETSLLRLEYGDISSELEKVGISKPGLKDVREVICNIRRRKLPDPAFIGNAGSFFKNPVISNHTLEALKQQHPDIPSFSSGDQIKVPAAWLISQCGWKGFRDGDAGVYPEQPLVLVNYGQADGGQLIHLANKMMRSVYNRFRITLEPEVNIF